MRIVGVFTLGFSVVVFGFYIVYKIILRYNQLKQIESLIEYVKQSIKYKKLPIVDIFNELKYLKKYDFLDNDFYSNEKIDYYKLCFENEFLVITNEQKYVLYEFLSGLGKSDVLGQEEYCEHYKSVINDCIKVVKTEKEKKTKLYPSLFMLFGILIIIVLI